MMNEHANMTYCLEHYIAVATQNERKKFSRIVNNQSTHIKTSIEVKANKIDPDLEKNDSFFDQYSSSSDME